MDAKTARKVARISANLDLVNMTQTELEGERDRLNAAAVDTSRWNDRADRQAVAAHMSRALAVRDLLAELNA